MSSLIEHIDIASLIAERDELKAALCSANAELAKLRASERSVHDRAAEIAINIAASAGHRGGPAKFEGADRPLNFTEQCIEARAAGKP